MSKHFHRKINATQTYEIPRNTQNKIFLLNFFTVLTFIKKTCVTN